LKDNYLSKIGIGTSAYGSRVSPSESESIIKGLLELGVNYIDTSPLYGAGLAEKIIGKSYTERDKIILSTKFGLGHQKKNVIVQLLIPFARFVFNFPIIENILAKRNSSHIENPLSIEEINKSVETSLKNLNTNYLDVLFIHNKIEYYLNNKDVMNYLYNLKANGVIKKIGLTTSLTDEQTIELISQNLNTIDVIQIPLSNFHSFSSLKVEINCFSAFSQGTIDKKLIYDFLNNGNGRLIVLFKTRKNILSNLTFFNFNS